MDRVPTCLLNKLGWKNNKHDNPISIQLLKNWVELEITNQFFKHVELNKNIEHI